MSKVITSKDRLNVAASMLSRAIQLCCDLGSPNRCYVLNCFLQDQIQNMKFVNPQSQTVFTVLEYFSGSTYEVQFFYLNR